MRSATAALLVLGCVLTARTVAAREVEVEVEGLLLDPDGGPVVRLLEKGGGGRMLPIWIGAFEAQAIALELGKVATPRPMTHDLMKALVGTLGGRLKRVVITALEDRAYVAALHLRAADGGSRTLDARPSDAIALALRLGRPILVEPGVFPARGPAAERTIETAALDGWGLSVQSLTPELAALVATPDARGVLVADVDAQGPAHQVLRGDVITRVDGRPVTSPAELVRRLESSPAAAPVRMSLLRRSRTLDVRVPRPADR